MIKIEFKEAKHGILHFEFDEIGLRLCRLFSHRVKSITPYTPTQDPYLDRSFILQQLGISKEQDDINQELWKSILN